ncbi:NAD(P)/FAD-dependent oxidoreductase [Methylocaldum sp.]|uniref:FAD-dependent oxidoreductase n=1 Tax=Methylocaldum sp. TaxID=1969727 RepID=UPI002D2F07DF|nr:NAD(P)/FAD-dependent oxidoreductase [Methylocaldum sp.]HYE34103.1 NAD(P)/FAD-dependent oxidoreductase [Methylocaldum sp.]
MRTKIVNPLNVDVLIAGGGVAGAAAAAALSQLDLSILIIEPGPSQDRRLAGELIHPPGVDGLRQLGLLSDKADLGSKVQGFAISSSDEDPASILLPYGERQGLDCSGLAIEHQTLKNHLFDAVRQFPGVTAWLGSRVTRMEREPDGPFAAVIRCDDGEKRVRARLIIGADGSMSQVRKLTGIPFSTHRYSAMMGIEVEDRHLPHPGYGNIFLNPAAGISYAYSIGQGRARIMFEVLRGHRSEESIRNHLSLFPASFRSDAERVLAISKPLAAANFRIIPDVVAKSNVVLVGDARGCCHPVTASGITTAVKDALILRDALRATNFDIPAALHRYSVVCGRLQLTRRTLAEELREAFLAKTPEALLLKQCIFSYWQTSGKSRTHSMALLSTLDSSIFSLAIQYALVVLRSFHLLPHWSRENAIGAWRMGVLKLLAKSLSFQHLAIRKWLKERSTVAG